MKKVNTTAVCIPSKHYMVDLTERVSEIRVLVEDGSYFAINRARQYGKTTTLNALRNDLLKDYEVISLDFQGIGEAGYETEEKFVQEFCRLVWNRGKIDKQIPDGILETIKNGKMRKSRGSGSKPRMNEKVKAGMRGDG